MLDHLLHFPSRADAGAALAAINLAQETEDGWAFGANVCLNIGGPNDESVRVGTQRAEWDFSDPEHPVQTQAEALIPGWYCIVADTLVNESVRDLPDNACRLIANREAAIAGDLNFVIYTAPDLTPETMAAVQFVEPTFVGSQYPCGTA